MEKTLREVNQQLLAAQEMAFRLNDRNTALLERVRELENQAREADDWKTEAEKYRTHEIAPGVFLMATKKAMYDPEGSVKLCHRCFQSKKQSILQAQPDQERMVRLHCYECNSTLRFLKYT